MKYSVRWYVSTSVHRPRSHVPTFPRSHVPTFWTYNMTSSCDYPLSHGSTGSSASRAASYNSFVSNHSISTSLFIRSIIPIPSSSFLTLKTPLISKLLIQSMVPSGSICWFLLLILPSLASVKYIYIILTILLLNKIMSFYSCYVKKGFIYITIISPFGCQPFSYTKCTKANICSLYNVYSTSDFKYIYLIHL